MDLVSSNHFPAYIQKLLDQHHVPGMSIAVAQGEHVTSVAFGRASLEAPKNFTADTILPIGSAAKSLTAAAVVILTDLYPHVHMTDTMASLLPDDFVMPGDAHADVTIEDVLSHRTGMGPHDFSILGPNAECPDDPRSITRNLRNLTCVEENRSQHVYCNMMYTVATHLVEHVSGISFGEYLKKYIFEPLGMTSTYLLRESVVAGGQAESVATGYAWDKHQQRNKATFSRHGVESQGAGQIFTSANDYVKWVRAMMLRRGPITERVFEELTRPRIRMDPDTDDDSGLMYALGWQVNSYDGYRVVSHDGGEDACLCNHFFLPDIKLGVVVFGNSYQAHTIMGRLTCKLIDSLLHTTPNGMESLSQEFESDTEDEPEDFDKEGYELELFPESKQPEPQNLPLSAYIGRYDNLGYHSFEVQEMNGELFIDGTDRCLSFTLTMKHICDQTKFIAYISQMYEDQKMLGKIEFRLKDNRAVAMGVNLEDSASDYIWFQRLGLQNGQNGQNGGLLNNGHV